MYVYPYLNVKQKNKTHNTNLAEVNNSSITFLGKRYLYTKDGKN